MIIYTVVGILLMTFGVSAIVTGMLISHGSVDVNVKYE